MSDALDDGQAVTYLERLGAKLRRAREAQSDALVECEAAAMVALNEGASEYAVAKALGVDRMTVRKWAGKR